MRDIAEPRGKVLADVSWVEDIARRYDLGELHIPVGSVVLERLTATGGRTFTYHEDNDERTWIIGLSLPRLEMTGREGMEGVVAHELLHAWLWSRHGFEGHGPFFVEHAERLGIPRWCESYEDVRAEHWRKQMVLL